MLEEEMGRKSAQNLKWAGLMLSLNLIKKLKTDAVSLMRELDLSLTLLPV
jgi:hypothetical protein